MQNGRSKHKQPHVVGSCCIRVVESMNKMVDGEFFILGASVFPIKFLPTSPSRLYKRQESITDIEQKLTWNHKWPTLIDAHKTIFPFDKYYCRLQQTYFNGYGMVLRLLKNTSLNVTEYFSVNFLEKLVSDATSSQSRQPSTYFNRSTTSSPFLTCVCMFLGVLSVNSSNGIHRCSLRPA